MTRDKNARTGYLLVIRYMVIPFLTALHAVVMKVLKAMLCGHLANYYLSPENMLTLRAKADRGWNPGTRTDSPKFLFFRYLQKICNWEP
uniref:Uncharacterized protein n=1 Tax=Candidatus Kentrum sp. TUN TaxID=2126343 RepID=A0A450ZX21_9GAMM|nr:MAG: hypothetical protein BECKTUN1418E_GA0071001_10493 [Candidatus Kentron sp. TUN]VFK62120.1 MAG: hypothetical protein BECKTUN1418D_GA0071000_11684 [Candidatus Kentron sp. TUN]